MFKFLCAAVISLSVTFFCLTNAAAQENRNVLLIMADDFNHWIKPVGYYDSLDTPNINELANQGVLFRDASSSSPVCNPSRQALMTGLRGTTSGIDSNQDGYFRDNDDFQHVVTLNQYFKDNGYYAYGGGKIYHGIKMGPADTDPNNWTDITTLNPGGGSEGTSYNWSSDESPAIKWSGSDVNVEQTGDRKLARHFEDKLRNYSQNEPFFMAVGLFRPHLPWNVPKSYYDDINPADLDVPVGLQTNDLNDTPYTTQRALTEVRDEGQYKNLLRAYLANMKFTDDNVGIILDGLRANGAIADNTIVAFMGDHGWMLGEKNALQKGSVYDQASRTTLVIYDPTAEGNGRISRKVVSLLDVHQTLIDVAGLPTRTNVEGNSLKPLLEEPNKLSWDNPVFVSLNGRDIIKTNEWRYVQEINGNGSNDSLYNIVDDPYEFDNLAQDSSYSDVIDDLKIQISQMKEDGSEVLTRVKSGDAETVIPQDEVTDDANNLRVRGPVNGIPVSDEYEVSLSTTQNGDYQIAHVNMTVDGWTGENDKFGYNRYVGGYKMSFVNFEFRNQDVWAKVKMPNRDIPDLSVRPNKKGAQIIYEEDTDGYRIAKINIQSPSTDYLANQYLAVVPVVDGEHQRDNALGLFANSFTPIPTQNTVEVDAGDPIPNANSLSAGQTVVFNPGTHTIGNDYVLKSSVDYYFSNGAFVRGFFERDGEYDDVRIYGLGILSSAHLARWTEDFMTGTKLNQNSFKLIRSNNVRLEEVTFVDPAHHTIILGGGDQQKNSIRKVKVLGWRANGDGIHVVGRADVEDVFLRTQDDSMYISSEMDDVVQQRVTTWNDFNGSAFIFTAGGGGRNTELLDSDVIYNRTRFTPDDDGANASNDFWEEQGGGAVFNLRGMFEGKVTEDIVIDGVRIDDEAIDRGVFWINMISALTAPDPVNSMTFNNITFRNITAAYGGEYPQRLHGLNNTSFPENITFECINIAGEEMQDLAGWSTENFRLNQISVLPCEDPTSEPDPVGVSNDGFLLNGDFEASDDEWAYWRSNSSIQSCGHNSTAGLKMDDTTFGGAWQSVQLMPGKSYAIGAWGSLEEDGARATLGIQFKQDSEIVLSETVEFTSTDFEYKDLTVTVPEGSTFNRSLVYAYKNLNGSAACIDDINVIELDDVVE